jgi:cytochrome bd-type quinol oxidase subunit 2
MSKPPNQTDAKKRAARKPRLSWTLAAAVVALQAGLLLTLAMTSTWQPPKVRALEAVWAWMQGVSLIPFAMLLIGGPVLTWLACRMDRKKIGVMSLCWAAFGLTLVLVFGAEAQLMMRSLWAQVPV